MFNPEFVGNEIAKALNRFEDSEQRARKFVWAFCNAAGWRSLGFDSVEAWLDSIEKSSAWQGVDAVRALVKEWIEED